MERGFFRETPYGVVLRVRLTPRADRDQVDGVIEFGNAGKLLAARVRAIPDKGSANTALVRLIAGWLNVPPSSVSFVSGATQRIKTLAVEGETSALRIRLEMLTS